MTANDSDVSDGETLTGSQVVRVYGENLTTPFVTLTFGEVEYTPLAQGEGYIEFILGDNGTATISVDGSPFMSFEVEGIVVPEELPQTLRMSQFKTGGNEKNQMTEQNVNCINYPFLWDEEYIAFRLVIGSQQKPFNDDEQSNYTLFNSAFRGAIQLSEFTTLININIVDTALPAYIMYKGFIIAVFNYTTN